MIAMKSVLRNATGLSLALFLAACSAVYENHGYVPPDDLLNELQVGVDSRTEVASAVGRPTATGVMGAEAWYYVQSRFRRYGYQAKEEVDREVVAITYNDAGTIANIERFGLEDGRVVPISRRVTSTNTQGISFLRQLFRNIGNFNPADFLGD
ncbi:outer membrane protein assembly factor BamE [Palleronia abyssalis]|uniref:Outer membrane protein assembly factor BamE domain-containing protein n=1 Tax=Palleronia abyssalis TaxID=1501240 RepID=A0A2R8C0Q1_9RHOB|nr:outer membrane protein assembly factor BamE [Palleronia abyssalis]SPJ25896.1 hypothetical protein PAA8504_03748 [Palleronia abyssalis]